MGVLKGGQRTQKRIKQAVLDIERLRPFIVPPRAPRPLPTSSVWVKPTGAPTDGVYDGTFQVWTDGAWVTTDEDCYVQEANGGTLQAGTVYLGRIVDSDEEDGLPIVHVDRDSCCSFSPVTTPTTVALNCTIASGSGPGSGIEPICCALFERCSGDTISMCTGSTLGSGEVAEFGAGCGDSLTIAWEICGVITCPATTWYCTNIDEPCTRLSASGPLCVTIKNGTRSYRAITSTGVSRTANYSANGWGFNYTLTDTDGNVTFAIGGNLRWCVVGGVPGLYFFGKIRSTNNDTDNPGQFDCGCLVELDDCSAFERDGSEEITAGPTGAACVFTGETLHITTDCGELDLVIVSGACAAPSPPPPPVTTCACSACAGGSPGRWAIGASGTLPAFDALDYVSGCVWTQTAGSGVTASMMYDGSTWKVFYTGGGTTLATYTISGAFACCASNTFNLTYSDPGITAAATISVTTSQSCSCPGPPAVTYDCIDGRCVDPGDGSGAYANIAACRAAPCDTLVSGKYYCVGAGDCSPGNTTCLLDSLVGGSIVCDGPFDTEAECSAGCGSSGGGGSAEGCCDKLTGKPATVLFQGGDYDGQAWSGVWSGSTAAAGCQLLISIPLSSGTFQLLYYTVDLAWYGGVSPYGVTTATMESCGPTAAIHTMSWGAPYNVTAIVTTQL